MVKVVGKDDSLTYKTGCSNCASILEFTKSETETATYTDYGGGRDSYRFIPACPCCGKRVEVKYYL